MELVLQFFFLEKVQKKKIGKQVSFFIIKPTLSSKILAPLGVDADSTDLFPINLKLLFILRNLTLFIQLINCFLWRIQLLLLQEFGKFH